MSRIAIAFPLLVVTCQVLTAEDAENKPGPAIVDAIEAKYSTEAAKADAMVAKAEAEASKAKKVAAEIRLKAYRDRLAEVTKTGDFDKAIALKARIEQLEKEPEADARKPTKRPRPKDTVRFDGHTYAMIKDPVTWHTAKRRCEEMGGRLAIARSVQEADFLLKLCGDGAAWLGASDEETEGDWRWLDGSPVTMKFDINNQEGFDHCMVIWDHHFADGTAGRRYWYICEWAH